MSQIHDMFASICVQKEDAFTVSKDCLGKLEEILSKLSNEDQTLRTYRRAIGFGQNISNDLLPLLNHVKDDAKTLTKIIDTSIKILIDLTIPIECLLSIGDMTRTDVGRHTIFELTKLVTSSKVAFTDSKNTKVIMDHIKFIIESDMEMNAENCESINNSLLLLRNILHIPETKAGQSGAAGMQNQIIWNLFTQSIDKVIIYLISCPQKMYWGVTMVQLIALLYKDQHVGTLQKLLNLWLEASLSESSEDNESNTSPKDQGSDDSSPIITSDPTSDSSDGGGEKRAKTPAITTTKKSLNIIMRGKSTETESSGVSSLTHTNSTDSSNEQSEQHTTMNGKKECPSSQSEDFGYATQVENQESISTSSNEDDQPQQKPVHQKPHSFQKTRYNSGRRATTVLDKKELRRKKLVKRSKTQTINMKGLMHHLPTDENIANILKEFTVDFLLKGYGTLVHDLHLQLLTNSYVQIDTSHFFWLVTYFLKFATQLELDLEHVNMVLSHEILSFLVFQGVWVYEELEMAKRIEDADLKPSLRRLHLVVTAIREFLQAVECYRKMAHLSEADRLALEDLRSKIVQMGDLRSLFLILLRQFNPNLQSRQYLQDLILTNHSYLLFVDGGAEKEKCAAAFNVMDHLKQFATVEIMKQYGLLLENFEENGEFVNNCIFTMMHHIGGDLDNVATLFQPSILKTFSQIWENDYEICDDWADLIEYIIHKFINSPRSNPKLSPGNADHEMDDLTEWTTEEKDNLLAFYQQSRDTQDMITAITIKCQKSGMKQKTQSSITRQLFEQNIINQSQYNEFAQVRNVNQLAETTLAEEKNTKTPNFSYDIQGASVDQGVQILRYQLCKVNKAVHVSWLQNFLIEVCHVKLMLSSPGSFDARSVLSNPIIYYFSLLNLPIPLVAWTSDQSAILKHQSFVLLLHKLGFYLPIDTGKIFVTIPNFWNAEHVFTIAQQLGPIDASELKFDVSILKGINKSNSLHKDISYITDSFRNGGKFSMNDAKQTPSMIRYTPLPNSAEFSASNHHAGLLIVDSHCIGASLGANECLHMDYSSVNEDNDPNSCETASIASDLTRMCVSDEEVLVLDKK